MAGRLLILCILLGGCASVEQPKPEPSNDLPEIEFKFDPL
jgi:hypothetical protein